MGWITLLLIAVGLAMDAFAVSVSCGLAFQRREHTGALKIALSFGLFQAGMPVLGWLAGLGLRGFVAQLDHWIAFALLAGVGGHMIFGAFRDHAKERPLSPPGFLALMALSVATSLDALAVGFSLSLVHVPIANPAAIIGGVTFLISFLGIVLGHESRRLLRGRGQRNIQVLGGLLLIGIGVKIIVQHLGG